MIVQDDIEQPRRVRDGTGCAEIAPARGRVARGMIVGEDQAGCPQIEGAADDLAREQIDLGDAAPRNALLRQDAVLGIEEESVDLLGRLMGEADEQIIERRLAVGQDRAFKHFVEQQLSDKRPDRSEQFDEGGLFGKAFGQGGLARTQQRRERTEVIDQPGGDRFRSVAVQVSDQLDELTFALALRLRRKLAPRMVSSIGQDHSTIASR